MAHDGEAAATVGLGFDPAALRARYRAERDKRLRPDGNEQYVKIDGDFAHYLDDPYVEPGFSRAPLADEVDVIVVGGGFGGLLAGARLRRGILHLPAAARGARLRAGGEIFPGPRDPRP
jgi:cyclohexanone monooxygenase